MSGRSGFYNATGPSALTGAARRDCRGNHRQAFQYLSLAKEALQAGLARAGLPPEIVGAILSIQTHFSEGAFDIATGDLERLSGKPPRPLRDVLANALTAL